MGILEAATQRMKMEEARYEEQIAALKAENERLMKALADMEAKKISLQDDALPKWINRAEAAERALAERAGGVKVPIGYALVPVEPTDRMVSAYVAAKPKGAGFNHPRKGDDKKAWFAAHEKKCRERWKAMLSVSTLTTEPAAPEGHHPDDIAVDRFAAAMKEKLARKREEGRGGWDDKEKCSGEYLSRLLREHVDKGDPVDVGNLAMMLHQRGERIAPEGQQDDEPVAWPEPKAAYCTSRTHPLAEREG